MEENLQIGGQHIEGPGVERLFTFGKHESLQTHFLRRRDTALRRRGAAGEDKDSYRHRQTPRQNRRNFLKRLIGVEGHGRCLQDRIEQRLLPRGALRLLEEARRLQRRSDLIRHTTNQREFLFRPHAPRIRQRQHADGLITILHRRHHRRGIASGQMGVTFGQALHRHRQGQHRLDQHAIVFIRLHLEPIQHARPALPPVVLLNGLELGQRALRLFDEQ